MCLELLGPVAPALSALVTPRGYTVHVLCVCYSSRRRAVMGHEGPAGSLLTCVFLKLLGPVAPALSALVTPRGYTV